MKKLTKIVLLVVVLVMSLVLATACETLENHEHKPATEWLSDGTSHYHACTFEGCTQKLDVTACAGGTATCTAKATCATCGNAYGEVLAHVYDQQVATADYLKTSANHSDKAVYYKSCVCGLASTTETFQSGETVAHEYTSVVTAPTCTTAGYTTYTCDCGHTYTADEVAALGHSYEHVVTDPTCTTAGYTTHTCSVCQDTYTDTPVDALGHTEANDDAKDPTCTETGLTAGKHCSVCDAVIVAQEVVPATGHSLENGTCTVCKGELVKSVPQAGKGYLFGMTQAKVQNNVYYLKGGMSGYYMATTTNPAEALLVYLEETEGGYYAYCYVSGTKTYINMVVSGTHVNGAYEATASTVYSINEGKFTIVAKVDGDDYWFGTRNDNTYTTMGPCKVSYNGFQGEFYDVCVHTWNKGTTTEPTCTTAGYTTYSCANCGKTKTDDAVTELGHDYKDGTCSVCGAADPDYVAPTPVSGGSADFGTITTSNANGDSSYTKTFTTANGWVTQYCAVQTGGPAGCSNPQFAVIGPNNTYKAVCLVGKTSTPGSITSPTLNGGISTFTLKYTKMFTDTQLSVTITVTDLATGTKYTHVISATLDKNEKQVVHEDVWTLETQITGDFKIEVVNNCPTGQDGNKDRFTILDLAWEGAKQEHTHEYTATTTATCTEAGTTTYTCACGDTYTEETPAGHIDANLDVECDREGCTSKVAPKADSTLSLATANALGAKLSTYSKYYVVGKIVRYYTEGDSRNGNFWIADENGVEFLIRMPKNEAGSVHSAWTFRLVIGDTVKFYGEIHKFTSGTTSIPSMQSGLFVEYISKHTCDFTNVPATCFEPAYCDCLTSHGTPADHVDANTDGACDNCGLNANLKLSKISTVLNNIKDTDAYDTTAGTATYVGADFTAVFAKGTAALNTVGTDHMRLQKGNTLTISANNGKKISAITFTASASNYVDEMEAVLTAAGFTYEVNGLHITIAVDNLDTFTLTNSASKIARIASIYVGYADAQ